MRIGHSAAALVAAVSLALGGCSSVTDMFKDKGSRIDYKRTERGNPLEVPPDLTQPADKGDLVVPELGEALASQSDKGAARPVGEVSVLPQPSEVKVMHEGQQRWLVVQAPVEQTWSRVRDFWTQNGLELKVEQPQIGIMETGWAENRADIPEDFIRSAISKVFPNAYSSPTRDKFRVRLERGDRGTTEVYLSHYGMEQVAVGDTQVVWQPRPSDPELVNELLNRMVMFLGAKQEQAKAQQVVAQKAQSNERARMVDGPALVVDEGFARAWRRAGLALDKLGFIVEDRNRSTGVYYVRHVDQLDDAGKKSKGWFTRLFSKDENAPTVGKRFQVLLREDGNATRVTILDGEGNKATDNEAKELLTRLRSELI